MSQFRRLLPAAWAVLTAGVVVAVAWAGYSRLGRDVAGGGGTTEDVPAVTRPATLQVGRDYYVLVKLVEFNPRKPDGDSWDARGGAPDPKVLLYWHGQQIFALPTRDDQFIATWDLFRVNVVDVARSGGNLDIAGSINAPILRVEENGPLRIEVYDHDTFSGEDLAAKIDLPLTTLVEGDNDIAVPDGSGVRRMVVQVIDRQTSLSDLIALASKR